MINLRLSRADVGRMLASASHRRRQYKRGLDKFAGNFDPELGASLTRGYEVFTALETRLKEAMDAHDNSRRTGCNSPQYEERD